MNLGDIMSGEAVEVIRQALESLDRTRISRIYNSEAENG